MLTLLLLHLVISEGYGADKCHVRSTTGTDFFFGIPGTYGNPASIDIHMTTDSSADVRVTAPFLNIDQHFIFTKHTTVSLGPTIVHMDNGTQFRGVELHSNAPIWAAVVLGNANNFEGFTLYPVSTLSTKYIVTSYPPYTYGNYYFSEFLVAGVDSDTTVTISLPSTYTLAPNATTQLQLQKYETYLYRSLHDLSATLVTSDKPVAVFSAVSCGQVPPAVGDCQYMVEQTLPTDVYDFTYIIPPILPTKNYYFRVYAAEDKTEVSFYNSTMHTTNFINERIPMEMHLYQEPSIIIANKPINVIIYSENPFMMTAQAVSQFQSHYDFALQGIYSAANTLAVTIKTEDIPYLYLDGSRQAITSANTIQVASPMQDYSIMYIDVSQSTVHRLHSANERRFGALLYGLPSTSYAYGMPLTLSLTSSACLQGNDTNTTALYPGHGLGSHINYKPHDNGVHCFSCVDMTHLKYCDKVTTCSQKDQVCYVQSYSKSLNSIRYKSGCIDKHICTSHSGQGCIECCDGSYCNTYGCGDDGLFGLENRGPFCFDCRHLGENDVCDTVQLCSVTEVCMIEKYKWGDQDSHYITGCTDAQTCNVKKRSANEDEDILNRNDRNVPVCAHCCSSDFCNQNCTTVTNPNIIGKPINHNNFKLTS